MIQATFKAVGCGSPSNPLKLGEEFPVRLEEAIRYDSSADGLVLKVSMKLERLNPVRAPLQTPSTR
jgi:hypothetical protein